MIESLNLKNPVEFTQSEIRERKQTEKKIKPRVCEEKIHRSYHWRPRGKGESGLRETMTEGFPEAAETEEETQEAK